MSAGAMRVDETRADEVSAGRVSTGQTGAAQMRAQQKSTGGAHHLTGRRGGTRRRGLQGWGPWGWSTGLLTALLTGLLTGLGIALAPGAAYACSCAEASAQEHFDHATVVATARLTETDATQDTGAREAAAMVSYTFEVEELLKGEAPRTLEVLSAASGAACGLERMTVDQDYLLFARVASEQDPTLLASLCDGTAPVPTPRLDEVRQVAADSGVQAQLLPETTTPAGDDPDDPGTPADPDSDEGGSAPPVPLVLGGVVLVLGLMAWWLIHRARH